MKALTDQVRKTNAEAARFVHWGATSQDVMDSAMSLLLKRAEPILIGDLYRLENALKAVTERHKNSVMVGRTLLQPAPPVTLGLKAADGWVWSVAEDIVCKMGLMRLRSCSWRSERHVGVARRPGYGCD